MNRYSLIYADPAWSYGNTISNGAAIDHYPTMSLLDMKRLPVWDLAADNAVLAMWYTGTHNQEAIELAEAWGFTVRTMKGFTWVKLNQLAELRITKALAEGNVTDFYDFLDLLNAETRMNGGNHTRANTEDVLIAISEEDATAEGVPPAGSLLPDYPGAFLTPKGDYATAKVAFQRLWESIYGEESWKANGWVWVISFKRVEGGAA
ncbi:TPA: hypothetical protein MIZ65_14925 [Klebsiella pneumoniae]|nr:hypothetical protein [Klebsiella pneumoniae]